MNNFKNIAKQKIAQKKLNAEKKASDTLQLLLSFDDFKNAYTEYQNAIINNAKKDIYEQIKLIDTNSILSKLEIIAKKHNMNYKDTTPSYSCKSCNDTGYYNNKACSCLKQQLSKELINISGIKDLPSFNNSNIEIFDNKKDIQILYDKMKKWCISPIKYKNIFLYGNVGVGKTYLSQCMANELISLGKFVFYTTAFNLNQDMLNYHSNYSNTYATRMKNYLDADCLIIDDLGTEALFIDTYKNDILNILNERTIKNKRTIFTTNLNLQQIEDLYGERFFSRIIDTKNSLPICVNNTDLRLKK